MLFCIHMIGKPEAYPEILGSVTGVVMDKAVPGTYPLRHSVGQR